MELNFNEWLLDQYLLEMVRAASPEESADWLKLFLQRASKSKTDWLRINAPYWLQSDNFNKLLSQVLLHKINVFNVDQKAVRNNIRALMVQELQKDVGFGSRRNMAYARSIERDPDIELHPAYGTDIAYKRKPFGPGVYYPPHQYTPRSEESKKKTSDSMKRAFIRKHQHLIDANPKEFEFLKMYYQRFGTPASDIDITLAALKELRKRVEGSQKEIQNQYLVNKIRSVNIPGSRPLARRIS